MNQLPKVVLVDAPSGSLGRRPPGVAAGSVSLLGHAQQWFDCGAKKLKSPLDGGCGDCHRCVKRTTSRKKQQCGAGGYTW